MLTVIFVFARRYFVSLKSSPLLFLLLAEVVFFFCEVITKLILGTCAWAWAWTHDGEKVIAVNLLKFLYLCSTNNLESDSTVLASLHTETPRTTCRERPETFFLWMFLLRQWLCHNENWNRNRIGCVTGPNKTWLYITSSPSFSATSVARVKRTKGKEKREKKKERNLC